MKQLMEEMNKRFDRVDEKLDKYSEQTVKNKQDITWIKGAIKIGLSAFLSLGAAMLTYIFKHIN